MNKNYIIGVSGASGSIYAANLLRALSLNVRGKSALIVSNAALRVYRDEINPEVHSTELLLADALKEIPAENILHQFEIFNPDDIGAAPASGSAPYEGMIVVPCSMKTLASIAAGISSGLMERAADVCLKERKKLILVPRETPYSMIHLKNMLELTQAGAVILPASPGFYHRPVSLNDLGNFITSKILSQLGITYRQSIRWEGDSESA